MEKPLGVAGKALIRKEGRILILERAPESLFDPGCWELPGGKIDYGEKLVEALRREVKEETGLVIKIGRPFKTWHFYKKPFWVTGITLLCDYQNGNVCLSPEHSNHAWIMPEDFLLYPVGTAVEEQIKAYLELHEDLKE